jgi:hypothetical protein
MAQGGIGDILKWGLILGGGYLAWNAYQSYQAQAATPAPAGGTTGGTTPPATPPPVKAVNCPTSSCPPTTDSIAVQKTKILAAAGGQGTTAQTASVWNYYFNAAYKLPQSTEWLLGDDGSPMTVDAYLALRQSKGFSGLGFVRVPVLFTPNARPHRGGPGGAGMYRRSNYVRAGTPMR